MNSAFNLFVFANSMFTQFFIWKGYVLSGEISPKNNHYYYYYYLSISLRCDVTYVESIKP